MGCFDPSGSKSTSTSESKTPEQKEWLKQALELYGPQLGQGADVFPGSRVAPFSTLQQQTVTGAGNFADYFSDPQTAGTPLFGETGTAIKGLLAGDIGAKPITDTGIASYFEDVYKQPAMKSLREDVNPAISEAWAGPGFWGSGRSHELSEAAKDTSDWLGEQRGQLNWENTLRNQQIEEAKAGRTQAAVPQAMAYGQVPAQEIKNNLEIAAKQIGGLNQIFGFGAAEQTQQQMELQDEIMRFAEQNQITDPENLSILLTLLGMNFSQSSSSGSSWGAGLGYAGTTSFLSGFGGGLGQGMATPSS